MLAGELNNGVNIGEEFVVPGGIDTLIVSFGTCPLCGERVTRPASKPAPLKIWPKGRSSRGMARIAFCDVTCRTVWLATNTDGSTL